MRHFAGNLQPVFSGVTAADMSDSIASFSGKIARPMFFSNDALVQTGKSGRAAEPAQDTPDHAGLVLLREAFMDALRAGRTPVALSLSITVGESLSESCTRDVMDAVMAQLETEIAAYAPAMAVVVRRENTIFVLDTTGAPDVMSAWQDKAVAWLRPFAFEMRIALNQLSSPV